MKSPIKVLRDIILFVSQMYITVYVFTLPQIKKMMGGVDGFVFTSFLFVACYCAINFWFVVLGLIQEKRTTERISLSTWSMFVVWILGVLIYGTFSAIFFVKTKELFNPNDIINSVFFIGGIAGVWYAKTRQGLGMKDPKVRLYFAVCLRVIPQVTFGLNILAAQNAKNLTLGFVIGFHALIVLRLLQNLIAIRETKHDANRKYVFVGEMSGWLSWFLVTGAWLMYR